MANYQKVTDKNFIPATGKKRIPVYADKLNNMLGTTSNTLLADTINEKTAGGGVTIDGLTIQDGAIASLSVTDLDLGSSGTAGSLDIFPGTASKGKLEIVAADSAGDTKTTITNASQAAARTYTVPDAGADASFVMTEGAATINGVKTFSDDVIFSDGAGGGDLSWKTSTSNHGAYEMSANCLALEIAGVNTACVTSSGIETDDIRALTAKGTLGTGVTAVHNGDGRSYTSVLTLTNVDLGTIAGAAAEATGALIYTFPAGALIVEACYMSVGLTNTDTNIDADTPDIGIGTVIASGAASVLSDTATFEDLITGQTATDVTGTATVKTALPTAGSTFIIESGDVHTVHLNIADTWAGAESAGVIANGTVTIKWTKMS